MSAYDYYNYVMNRNGNLKTWGDADFARKLVEFANIEVITNPGGLAGVLGKLARHVRAAALRPTGARQNPEDYSPDVTGRITEELVRERAQVEEAVLHLVGARPRRTARTWR